MARPCFDNDEFNKVAEHCSRWKPETIDIARTLLVEQRPITEVAKAHNVSPQRANLARQRFLEKAEQVRLEEFRQKQQPQKATADALMPHARNLARLLAEGYSLKQLADYLSDNGIQTTQTAIRELLEGRS